MAKKTKELSALEVGRMKTRGFWAVGGVPGLYLVINAAAAKSWILRLVIGDKRRDMGLGGFPGVTLSQAREAARTARGSVVQGVDPITAKKAASSALSAQQTTEKTFKQAAAAYIDSHGDTWKNAKDRAQWTSTLETYAYPVVGNLLTCDVGKEHVLAILSPIWKTKTETAKRLRGRIELILDWATAHGYRTGENPARWKGHLDKLLAMPSKVKKVVHHSALSIDAMPGFMGELRGHSGVSAKALEFLILTAARSGEVRGATWAEFDMRGAAWVIPGERMKAGREHRVPLSKQALELLHSLPRIEGNNLVFSAPRGGLLSDMAMTAVTRRMNYQNADKKIVVPHGMRSTFRDWCGERTNYPRDLAELALSHSLENKVEAAYRRGDAMEKRRGMMQTWADHCDRVADGVVVPIGKKSA